MKSVDVKKVSDTVPDVKVETKPIAKVEVKPEIKVEPTKTASTLKVEDKPKTSFTKVAVRNPTPTRGVDDTPKITPPQESTRAVGLKK